MSYLRYPKEFPGRRNSGAAPEELTLTENIVTKAGAGDPLSTGENQLFVYRLNRGSIDLRQLLASTS